MSEDDNIDPRNFLLNAKFSPEEVDRSNPGARGVWTGGLFISHSGLDETRIRRDIVRPVIEARFPSDGHFLHNRGSGGAWAYRKLILAALNFCDKFVVVVSKHSTGNTWVQAEVEWAFAHRRPVIVLLMDDSDWVNLCPPSYLAKSDDTQGDYDLIDFRCDKQAAQTRLASVLDSLLQKLPYTGIYRPKDG
jgi:hypothetical protein